MEENCKSQKLESEQSTENHWGKKSHKESSVKKNPYLDLKLLIALAACIASIVSAFSSSISSREAIRANKFNVKPYIVFKLMQNPIPYNGPPHAVLKYVIENVGGGPALEIYRSYKSNLINKKGIESEIGTYRMGPDDLLPMQSSPVHMDDINISGFNIDNDSFIKVNLKATYQADPEVDKNKYYSKVFLKLIPLKQNEKIIFFIAQTESEYGIETER